MSSFTAYFCHFIQNQIDETTKTAKSHKWGEHVVAILTAIVLADATVLRHFLMSKKNNK